jgi:hypothetical protein
MFVKSNAKIKEAASQPLFNCQENLAQENFEHKASIICERRLISLVLNAQTPKLPMANEKPCVG